jgi:hypothetical protein|tara:strand:- start:264 stop:410 length:147 start_codon:yes stop_codon:yes gene_type:complete
MDKKKKINIIGRCITAVSLLLGGYCFGWELSVVIYLALLGGNLENYNG